MNIWSSLNRWIVLPGFIALACVALGGCSTAIKKTAHHQNSWGSHATLFPSWKRVAHAAKKAASNPQTWVPVVGATLFSATDWDKEVSDWAQEQHPVYGSKHAALSASDDLRDTAKYGALATALLTPNGEDSSAAVSGKLKGIGLQLGAYYATERATTILKRGVNRRRPSKGNNRSFPSGHTSAAFSAGTLARRNVAASEFSPTISRMLDASFLALGAGTSWARVEAGVHYPSDVFAGAALGYFIAAVVNDAFIGGHPDKVARLTFQTERSRVGVGFEWDF